MLHNDVEECVNKSVFFFYTFYFTVETALKASTYYGERGTFGFHAGIQAAVISSNEGI